MPSREDSEATELRRVLSVVDLTVMGMGATIGSGVYTLIGVILHSTTGPAIVISFLISAVASALSALCYAEFACRVPKAGSAYLYSYVTVGEGAAWFTGWQLVLEYMIGSAACAKGLTNYVDALLDQRLSAWMKSTFPSGMSGSEVLPYFDVAIVSISSTSLSEGDRDT